MFNRIKGVFQLNSATFEEIEHDQNATGQAALVVALVAVLVGLGGGLTAVFSSTGFIRSFFGTLVWAFVGWIAWSVVSYVVGTSLFKGQADLGEMLRVIGFAMAPLALSIIPCIGGIAGSLWSMAAAFVAVRQGLDFDNNRALLTMLIGFLVFALGYLFIAIFAAGVGLLGR